LQAELTAGKQLRNKDRYDPRLLVRIPRRPQREEIGIGETLPFTGIDIWTAYELSWLDQKGKPHVALGTVVIPADSPSLIESKSFKLYLNSFSQTPIESVLTVKGTIEKDISAACGSQADVALTLPEVFRAMTVEELEGEYIDDLEVNISDYQPNSMLLLAGSPTVEETLSSNLLKTNCPLTGQPDWGSIQIQYRGPRIDRQGLLKYLVSYRQYQAFHEHCVERIFMDLLRQCQPERLSVYARYTRRGGLDINPFRTNCDAPPPRNFPTARQ
jgi:7-cyano-7-deazaguanine reductase